MMGHDRFQADLRPLLRDILQSGGLRPGLCCHPYDLCTELIATEAGVQIVDEEGAALAAPLDLTADVTWIGYANFSIRTRLQLIIEHALTEHGLLRSRAE